MRNIKYYFENEQGNSADYGILFPTLPVITLGQEQTELKEIAGRKGTLAVDTGIYSDTVIQNSVELRVRKRGDLDPAYLRAVQWIRKSRKVVYKDAENYFYKVKKVEVGEPSHDTDYNCTFDFTFTCEPGVYISGGEREMEKAEVLYNPYSLCEPIYYITGEGYCILIVNGKTMNANVGQNLTIDTERMLAYREDGTLQNTQVTGDYEDLYLQPGENTITITSGFDLKIIPNWRCL
ncbi:MAG TPA: hypothetical protein IAA44_00700 [Candidatus Blautia avistercoris]|nr:hypothetical protein [Candidatus Blautia avistercoris]